MSDISIRKATVNDARLIYDFIVELAVYEKAKHEVLTTSQELEETLFGPGSVARALVCSIDDLPVGYAVYFYNYSTWLGKKGIYLEDVYVTPDFRGRGAGKAMLLHLARQSVEEGCGRFEWSVLDWNKPSIDFYESLGAKAQSEWITYRLTGEPLKVLAEIEDI